MHVEIAEPADMAIRTLGPDDRQRVQAWFGHLQNWDQDPFVRDRSHPLPSSRNTYVLQTRSDLRIFFTKEDDTITVFDIAKRPAILLFGPRSGGAKFEAGSQSAYSVTRPKGRA